MAADSPCVLASAASANPTILLLGEAAEVRLRVLPQCPGAALHLVLVIDTSSSMDGTKINAVKNTATTLIQRLKMPTHPMVRIGVVVCGGGGKDVSLTNNDSVVIAAVKQLHTLGGCEPDRGVAAGLDMLMDGRQSISAGDEVEEAILLFTDSQLPAAYCQRLVDTARRAISRGVTMAAICVQDASCDDCLPKAVSSRRWYFQVTDVSSLVGAVVGLRDKLKAVTLRHLAVVVPLPDNMRLVPGSAVPAPKAVGVSPGQVVWETDVIPTSGLTFTLAV